MQANHEELMELIDLWNYSAETQGKIRELLLAEKVPPPHLFRYNRYDPKSEGKVQQAERLFAETMGAKHALAVNSGTSALMAALAACGIGPGDEVLVPGYTFFASASVVVASRAIPVICEVNDSLNIDPEDMERKITPQTKAVIVVHMRGLCADMDEIMAVARRHELRVIEDVAQACGGSYKGRMLGTFGDCGCFSFDFYKIAMSGEGGFVITNDEFLHTRAQSWHDTAACWRPDRYARERMPGELFCGENYRMSELQGAVALAQIRKLKGYLDGLRRAKKAVRDRLDLPGGFSLRRQPDPAGDTAIAMIVFAPSPEKAKALIAALKERGVSAGGRFDATVRDWHIYSNWEHILERKTLTAEGCPFTCPYYKGALPDYHPDMCPKTLDFLSRSVHIGVSGSWNDAKCAEIAKTINEAAASIARTPQEVVR
ncbi:MAG: DegT/DnrJ/EryC1/StrS family aminotransferase [Planctomycetota bacterium]